MVLRPRLSRLFVYPVKSLRGIEVEQARLTRRGLAHDRRFMVVAPEGRFVTQRELGAMATVRTEKAGERLRLTAPEGAPLEVPLTPEQGETRQVTVWGDAVDALDLGDPAARWLEKALGRPLRLVYMPDASERPVDPSYAEPGRVVSFADGFPLLAIGEASLADLNARLDADLPMERFRPNLVFAGTAPYAEDRMAELQVGAARLFGRKPCARCVITTLDHQRGVPEGPSPLKALARYRRAGGKVYFGQNVLPDGEGVTLRVGDPVRVWREMEAPAFHGPARPSD